MKKHTTHELLEYIQRNNFTDIIFDFDKTLMHLIVDWQPARDGRKKLAEEYGIFDETSHMDSQKFGEFFIQKTGEVGKKKLDELLLSVEQEHFQDIVSNMTLIHFLKEYQGDLSFHILSNNMNETIEKQIKSEEIEHLFENIYGRNRVFFSKPHPEGIQSIIDSTGREKNGFLMVGDNPHSDGEAAERAGVDYFLIDMYL